MNNPYNPNFPPQDVSVGEGTEDEMFLIYMNLSSYVVGDTNIIIDTASHYPHDASCFQTTGINDINQLTVTLYPNPTTGLIRLDGSISISKVVNLDEKTYS